MKQTSSRAYLNIIIQNFRQDLNIDTKLLFLKLNEE